MINIFW